ncbi:YjcZ family sporulation protein [Bacillus sp. 31A1R]|uniref:YjcZ family sporulation protein n=1 Tax=Robertmurraya mangrovi TaxID=3098077 RepID=A0ABU5IZ09_9BACI|nr:YjcZ family sporulation protein [Bacillus sp. 31A1R]MDZ5472362.1 YjcZ family sporulation protein [Bacillus sp. 31A1R]
MKMYANLNAPLTQGVNLPPKLTQTAPAVSPNVAPIPTYTAPAYAYCYPTHRNNDFILIVVLFILLIIVGACTCYFNHG